MSCLNSVTEFIEITPTGVFFSILINIGSLESLHSLILVILTLI